MKFFMNVLIFGRENKENFVSCGKKSGNNVILPYNITVTQ